MRTCILFDLYSGPTHLICIDSLVVPVRNSLLAHGAFHMQKFRQTTFKSLIKLMCCFHITMTWKAMFPNNIMLTVLNHQSLNCRSLLSTCVYMLHFRFHQWVIRRQLHFPIMSYSCLFVVCTYLSIEQKWKVLQSWFPDTRGTQANLLLVV